LISYIKKRISWSCKLNKLCYNKKH
jgi:hypothetical protein